ncbi:hypothetical protein Ecaj_0689 [Ehrlichia canis str. Jake]|uniref:Uncharacterized protein n=1 Tax=Ehrlichia canis (strain Jake) TaxID=269484 RepID=A0ACA6AWG9_EHRCJ|nr:hypothetical protein Ecaj_0689 [Ehrlichia canis str. Jake]
MLTDNSSFLMYINVYALMLKDNVSNIQNYRYVNNIHQLSISNFLYVQLIYTRRFIMHISILIGMSILNMLSDVMLLICVHVNVMEYI